MLVGVAWKLGVRGCSWVTPGKYRRRLGRRRSSLRLLTSPQNMTARRISDKRRLAVCDVCCSTLVPQVQTYVRSEFDGVRTFIAAV